MASVKGNFAMRLGIVRVFATRLMISRHRKGAQFQQALLVV